MFGTVTEMRQAMAGWASRFDPALIDAEAAMVVLREVAVIEKIAATVKAMAAARVADTSLWRDEGDRSAAHRLAKETGTSPGAATETLETGRRLRGLDATREKALAGDLSPQQAAAIADAAAKNPEAEQELLDKASSSSLGQLRDECAKAKAAKEPDPDAKRRRIHAERYLREYVDRDGAWNLKVRTTTDIGAQIMAALAPLRDKVFAAARREGRRERAEAYAADALTELATTGAGTGRARGSVNAKLIGRFDVTALLRGHPIDGEVCDIVGFGPVPVSTIRSLMDTADPFLAAVLTNGVDVMSVAHLGRKATAFQRTALEWMQPTCAVDICDVRHGLQIDHRVDWSDTHITWLAWLDRMCSHHHDKKTREGWALVEGRGKRPFVPPHDPRHPANAPPATGAA